MAPSELLQSVALAAGAFLLGSLPFAYLVARARGVELRRTGSGVPSVANVGHALGFLPAALAFVGEVGKAMIPAGIVYASLGADAAAAVALWAMVGHNWSPWLRFNGGRGMGIVVGAAALLLPRELALIAILLVPAALVLRDTAPPSAVGLLLAPALAIWLGESPGVTLSFLAMAAVVLVRRATAPPPAMTARGPLWSRLLFDRPDPRRHWTLD